MQHDGIILSISARIGSEHNAAYEMNSVLEFVAAHALCLQSCCRLILLWSQHETRAFNSLEGILNAMKWTLALGLVSLHCMQC